MKLTRLEVMGVDAEDNNEKPSEKAGLTSEAKPIRPLDQETICSTSRQSSLIKENTASSHLAQQIARSSGIPSYASDLLNNGLRKQMEEIAASVNAQVYPLGLRKEFEGATSLIKDLMSSVREAENQSFSNQLKALEQDFHKWDFKSARLQLEEMNRLYSANHFEVPANIFATTNFFDDIFQASSLQSLMEKSIFEIPKWVGEHQATSISGMSEVMRSMQEALRATIGRSEIESHNRFADELQSLLGIQSTFLASEGLKAAALSSNLISAYAAFEIANEWSRNGYGDELLDLKERYLHLIDSDKPDVTEINEFAQEVKWRLWDGQRDLRDLFNLILVLVMWLSDQVGDSRQNAEEARRDMEIKVMISTLTQSLSEMEFAMTERSYIVLARPAGVLAQPASGSTIIGVLLPNQTARLIGAKGKWIQISYLDLNTNEYLQGWVLKKYLVRLPSEQPDLEPKATVI